MSQGLGSKTDFTDIGDTKFVPGPIYDHQKLYTIATEVEKKKTVTQNGFFNKFDKYENICYEGMEKAFYCKEGKGPGAYLGQETVMTSPTKNSKKFSISKADRGLIGKK